MFERFVSRARICATLVVRTGLHMGAGAQGGDPSLPLNPVIRDGQGQPFIPGASFKGALRAHVEALARTLGLSDGKVRACDPFGDPLDDQDGSADCADQPCITKARRKEFQAEVISEVARGDTSLLAADRRLAEQVWAASCPVCRLFGSPWLSSHVLVRDLRPQRISAIPTRIRDGVGLHRDRGIAAQGIKYTVEVVEGDTRFALDLRLENLNPQDEDCRRARALLALALLRLPRDGFRLGGKSSRGLGEVDLLFESLEETDLTNLRRSLIDGHGRPLLGHAAVEARLREWARDLATAPGGERHA